MTADALSLDERAHPEGTVVQARLHGRTRLNVVGTACLEEAAQGLRTLSAREDLRCVVLAGASDAAFIGGADLKELGALTRDTAARFIRSIHAVCAAIRDCPVPVIGCVEGFCIGGGLEIAAACDFRISADTARYGMPEVRVGVPSVIEAALLPGLIGWGRTRELLLRGHLIDAHEALRIGLVEHCVAPASLAATVDAAVADILAGAPGAIRAQKRLVRRWEETGIAAAIEAGVDAFVAAYGSTEPAERVAAFFAARERHGGRT